MACILYMYSRVAPFSNGSQSVLLQAALKFSTVCPHSVEQVWSWKWGFVYSGLGRRHVITQAHMRAGRRFVCVGKVNSLGEEVFALSMFILKDFKHGSEWRRFVSCAEMFSFFYTDACLSVAIVKLSFLKLPTDFMIGGSFFFSFLSYGSLVSMRVTMGVCFSIYKERLFQPLLLRGSLASPEHF